MKFGPVPVNSAGGALLAHSVTVGGQRLRKGQVLSPEHVAALQGDGINEVIVARLDDDDLDENRAAERIAQALVPDPSAVGLRLTDPFTGRVNLIAEGPGVVSIDADAIRALNAVHPMITVATVPEWQQVGAGQMVATIKIISYAVREEDVARAADAARAGIRLCAPVYAQAGLVVTDIPGGPDNAKGISAIRDRLAALGIELGDVREVPHDVTRLTEALSALGGDFTLILTGSATSDIDDVAPSAVRRAGGTVDRFGMPVDPGNLLFLGSIGAKPVIGLPGCARSPALNGADWVLSRVACGVEVTGDDIAGMGVGGLLKEIPTRPQPRAGRRG